MTPLLVIMAYFGLGFLTIIFYKGWLKLQGRADRVGEPFIVALLWPFFCIAALFILFDLGTD